MVRPRTRRIGAGRRLAAAAACVVATAGGWHASVGAAPPEVRGTWLSTTGPDHIASGASTGAVMRDLARIGLNTVYVETWKNGYTQFPSATLAPWTGGRDRTPSLGTRDLLQETLIEAHRQGLLHVGWFEYGFSSQFIGAGGTPSNPLSNAMKSRGWLLQDQQGAYANASNGFAWMNPAVPEVRQLLIGVVLDAVRQYDLDGVQLDDRLAWPREFGWDATTAALYQQETGRALPTSVSDSRFRTWRQQKVTLFAQELSAAVRQARPDLLLSVSPSITGFAETNYNADWTQWVAQGLFDEYVPQAYRDSLGGFNAIVDAQTAPFAPLNLDEVALGLRINGSGANTPSSDVTAMIQRSRSEGAAGHSLWYSKGVRDEYASHLTAFYNAAALGTAANPHFESDRRPLPVAGQLLAGTADRWQFAVPAEERYRLVGRSGTTWKEVGRTAAAAGTLELAVGGFSQVELLVDRRPPPLPDADFNADGRTDGADLALLESAWGKFPLGGALASQGDADRDGRVGGADWLLWQRTAGVAPSLASVPEPAGLGAAAVAAVAVVAARRRARYGWRPLANVY